MSKPQTEYPLGGDATYGGTCIYVCIILQKKTGRLNFLFIYKKAAYTKLHNHHRLSN